MSSSYLSLTYDGTQMCHLETVVPHLQKYGLRATFYAEPTTLLENLTEWQDVQAAGHEIGNGCLFASALPDGTLPAFTPNMIAEDAEESDFLLDDLFPDQAGTSFGMPWGDDRCAGNLSYLPYLAKFFNVIRTGERGINPLTEISLQGLKTLPMEDLEGPQIIELIRLASHQDCWAILAFDGVGSGDRAIDAACHEDMCAYLASEADRIMTRPVMEIADLLLSSHRSSIRLI